MSKKDTHAAIKFFTPTSIEDVFLQVKRSERSIISYINGLILVVAIASLCIIGGIGAMLVMMGGIK
jgi:hypothetical protein